MEKINLHTHCNFCDGKNTAEEMILSAIQKGFTLLGFSSHSMLPYTSDWHIPVEKHEDYVKTIHSLKEKYKDKIEILCGFEVDYIPGQSMPEKSHFLPLVPDYIIGSVHYTSSVETGYTVDDSTENVKKGLEEIYKNKGKELVCQYFDLQRQMIRKGDFEIWGHADLIRKRNGILKFFNEEDSWYKNELKETVKVAAKKGLVAEINTGAIARKAMDDVYPSKYFLELMYQEKIPVCVNSDSHDISSIDCAFDRAYTIARNAGYTELIYPTAHKIYTVKL